MNWNWLRIIINEHWKFEFKALDKTHFDVGTSYDNLGVVCKDVGDLEEAKDYHRRALEINIKALGPTHVKVAGSYNILGNVYQDVDELEQAKIIINEYLK